MTLLVDITRHYSTLLDIFAVCVGVAGANVAINGASVAIDGASVAIDDGAGVTVDSGGAAGQLDALGANKLEIEHPDDLSHT